MVVLILRLYFLQVMSGEIYAEIASGNITRTRTVSAPRGNIYDRNGKLLVKSIPVMAVAVEPHMVLKNQDVIRTLSRELKISYMSIVEKLENSDITYIDRVILKTGIDKGTMIYIMENSSDLPGVEVIDIYLREYNYGQLASHILGYTREIDENRLRMEKYKTGYEGGDQIGVAGVEAVYEDILRGIKGRIIYEVDPLGRPVTTIEESKYIPGNDIYLTIDIELQRVVEEILLQTLLDLREVKVPRKEEYYNAPGGAVVVLNPKNGEILAMASYPTFNPEIFVGGISISDWNYLNDPDNYYPQINRAMMGFPPGSTFKIIPAYAGLEEEIITENKRFFCGGTWYGMGSNFPKECWYKGGHGSVNIYRAIDISCDIYFYEVGHRLFLKNNNEDELLQKYSRLFGFGTETGIDLPDENEGLIGDKEWKRGYFKRIEESVWYPGDTVNIAIGQGFIGVTPLQLAHAYAVLANRGIDYTPHVVKEAKDKKEEFSIGLGNDGYEDLFLNESFIDMIEKGLILSIKQGTGAGAFRGFPLNEITVAGKTGTSEMNGRQDYAWFVAYAPVENPEYVIAVMLEEGGSGGRNAGPVAEKIFRYVFNIDR